MYIYIYIYIYIHNRLIITSWASMFNETVSRDTSPINRPDQMMKNVKNLLYYKHWTDKWKYILYISVTHKVFKSCRSEMATWTHDVCDVLGASSLCIKTCWQSSFIYMYNTYIWVILTRQKFSQTPPPGKIHPPPKKKKIFLFPPHQTLIPSTPTY